MVLRRDAGVVLRAAGRDEHGVDERVFVPSVIEAAQVIALFIADWCGLSAH